MHWHSVSGVRSPDCSPSFLRTSKPCISLSLILRHLLQDPFHCDRRFAYSLSCSACMLELSDEAHQSCPAPPVSISSAGRQSRGKVIHLNWIVLAIIFQSVTNGSLGRESHRAFPLSLALHTQCGLPIPRCYWQSMYLDRPHHILVPLDRAFESSKARLWPTSRCVV